LVREQNELKRSISEHKQKYKDVRLYAKAGSGAEVQPAHPIYYISLDKYFEKEEKLKAEHAKLKDK
jgi:hypothetical protein